METTLRQQLEAFNNGIMLDSDGSIDSGCFNFYDWFCSDKALENKSIKLFKQVKTFIKHHPEINLDTHPEYIVNNYQKYGYTYLKFVVETEDHFAEVVRAVDLYRAAGFDGPVYVMPQGGVVTPYEQNRRKVADMALERGWYYSPRLHVDLWGNGWGK